MVNSASIKAMEKLFSNKKQMKMFADSTRNMKEFSDNSVKMNQAFESAGRFVKGASGPAMTALSAQWASETMSARVTIMKELLEIVQTDAVRDSISAIGGLFSLIVEVGAVSLNGIENVLTALETVGDAIDDTVIGAFLDKIAAIADTDPSQNLLAGLTGILGIIGSIPSNALTRILDKITIFMRIIPATGIFGIIDNLARILGKKTIPQRWKDKINSGDDVA